MNAQQLRIVIVGGVAGGASAATRARRLNEHAHIIMFEKDEHVSFANCGLPYYIGGEIEQRDKLLVATPELFRGRFNIDVRTRQEVTAIHRERREVEVLNHLTGNRYFQAYDRLILAPGASPIVPPIEGVDAPNVFTLRNLADADRIKDQLTQHAPDHVTVIGAGFIGLEMVEQLVRLGVSVSLAELKDQVLPLMDAEMAEPLAEALRDAGVQPHLGDGIAALERVGGRASAVILNSGVRIATDAVVMGIGVRPNTKLAQDAGLEIGAGGGIATNDHMQTSDPLIYAVGDAAEYTFGPTDQPMRVPLAGPANRAGRIAGEHAATGKSSPMAPVLGTAIVRVFEQSAGMTGLTMQSAERFGIAARSVTVIAGHHAGYFPGAEPITLKLVYSPDDRRVLGAQAVGAEGVDKRLDVIATAMRFCTTVDDLAGLDLAYAPPFGSAKDVIHMAAFAACNDMDGVTRFVPADADLDDVQVLDVRTADEVALTPLTDAPGAIHIPLGELRGRLGELDPHRRTIVSCATGLRAHVAARVLSQHGFDNVSVLSGGATVRNRTRRKEHV